jgi:hypothetical protein
MQNITTTSAASDIPDPDAGEPVLVDNDLASVQPNPKIHHPPVSPALAKSTTEPLDTDDTDSDYSPPSSSDEEREDEADEQSSRNRPSRNPYSHKPIPYNPKLPNSTVTGGSTPTHASDQVDSREVRPPRCAI